MKDFFKFFKVPLIIFAVVAVVFGGVTLIRVLSHQYTRGNTTCTETERVFDYADVLTDEEESDLRTLIDKKQDEVGCDIIIVTLNESLEEYAKQYDSSAYGSDYVMIYADNFYDEHAFGYDEAYGDGVLFLDNKFRETSTGKVYDWMSTSGRAEDKYSMSMIDDILYATEDYIDTNDFKAYSTFVNQFARDMSGKSADSVGVFIPFMISLVVAVVFLLVNIVPKKGKKTTTARTFVDNQKMNLNTDTFLRKTVTQRHIDTSSSGGSGHSGGGGHHTSSGGHSHGGGGHSR